MSRTKDCLVCGEDIVFLQDDNDNWVPVSADEIERSDRRFEPEFHTRHLCTPSRERAS